MRKIKSRFQRRGSRQLQSPEQRDEVRSETLNGAGAVTRLTTVDPIPVPTPVPTNRPAYVLALPAPPRNGNVVLPNGTHNIVDEEINMEVILSATSMNVSLLRGPQLSLAVIDISTVLCLQNRKLTGSSTAFVVVNFSS
ncbi:hypothetical protein K2173_012455 [Erythroxylum novogranatense]|uniref:Uncharacterized protein n=1 Tax=Erythroxylum novogranatense TaxID=1862640 RepID=A0AAV8S5E2_9ROSI|nr:hypothetical protein K2173_012455 [Erythroxylum novogranatense]